MRRIGVLTSGGDSAGMNAAIRAVVRSADAAGLQTYGIRDGYAGLVDGRLAPLTARDVSGILQMGGTMLGTARSPAFHTIEGRQTAVEVIEKEEIDGLIVIGGDGSMRGADAISRESGLPVIGVPGTIDNDLYGTDFTIGFDTAVNVAVECIDRIRDTAESHGRLFFIEVMGRSSGWIALYSAIAGGATNVLMPEVPSDFDALRDSIQASFDLGKRYCIVVVAEGDDAGGAFEISERVSRELDVDQRVSVLGHMQRGGAPSMRDRILGALLGDGAVQALVDGENRVMIGVRHGGIAITPMVETWEKASHPPDHLVALMGRLAR